MCGRQQREQNHQSCKQQLALRSTPRAGLARLCLFVFILGGASFAKTNGDGHAAKCWRVGRKLGLKMSHRCYQN